MKKHIASFFKRGLMASVGGPVIMAVVFYFLNVGGVVETLSVNEMVLGIITSAILAFVAGGITVVYNMEKLPLLCATLIHSVSLFADYIIIYLINGWISFNQILLFTGIFIAGYVIVWVIVYFAVKLSIKRLNQKLNVSDI